MNGYQLSFFTQQNRRHGNRSLAQWLIETAKDLGISGATMIAGTEGFGHDKKIHSIHFFDLADQPIEITMAVSTIDADRLFALLKTEGVNVFFTKTPIEFGMTGEL
jgi:uncharacterized protein